MKIRYTNNMGGASGFLFYVLAFVGIWYGSGLVIKSVDRIAQRIRLSSFAVAFFVLGLLTSMPETAVSINAILGRSPEIFVGTFLGGSVVIFLLIIPLMAVLGGGVKLNHDLDKKTLLALLLVIATPGLMILDRRVTNLEGLILIVVYGVIFYEIEGKRWKMEKKKTKPLTVKAYAFTDLAQVAMGIATILVASQFIVSQTLVLAKTVGISPFYISLLVLAVGTNLPELSLGIRAIISGKKDVAFGDYLGSAAANTLLFGVFTILNDGEVFTFNSFGGTMAFLIVGLGLFYFFALSKKDISRKEGLVLLAIYIAFIGYEVSKGLLIW